MAIVGKKPLSQTPVQNNPQEIKNVKVLTNFIDTKKTPLTSLITYIEGSKWEVDLYLQVIGNNDALTGQDFSQSGVYQQYKKIKNFQLTVSNPLSQSQDNETKAMTITGSGFCHSSVIVNQGDMFCADVGDGREGIFQITLSEQKSMFSQTVYFVEYTLVYFTDASSNKKQDLENKVVITYHYIKDYLNWGDNPLVIDQEFNVFIELNKVLKELIDLYFQWFFSIEKKTFLLPDQNTLTYDHFLVKFLLNILTIENHSKVQHTKILNVNDDIYVNQGLTLFDAVYRRNNSFIRLGYKKCGTVSARTFTVDPMQNGIRYTGIGSVIYPIDPVPFHNSVSKQAVKLPLTNLVNVGSSLQDINDLIPNNNIQTQPTLTLPNIKNVLSDDYYVFSEHFYSEDKPRMSKLELLVYSYINNNVINAQDVFDVVKPYLSWGGLEKYYYLPICIALIKSILKQN